MITNLPPEAQEAFEESAHQLASMSGKSYEEAWATLMRVFEAFTSQVRIEVWAKPLEGGCDHVHVRPSQPMR